MKAKTFYCCSNCGYESTKWLGKCPACNEWNTLKEVRVAGDKSQSLSRESEIKPMKLAEITSQSGERAKTGIDELDNVLGGGLTKGSLVLLGGEPGIGKSTLLLSVCEALSKEDNVLYVSGEESEIQIKMRADRLGIKTDNLYILPETNIEKAFMALDETKSHVCIIDSVQTMFSDMSDATGGSVSQIRDVTMRIMRKAKETGVAFFIVGHVTKDGNIAGPRLLEHMVDTVLYFEGDRNGAYRFLRAVKNRFGGTNEVGVFEMTDKGLKGVPDISQALLSGRPDMAPGSAVTCLMEGSRPMMAEIQSLCAPTLFGMPRRATEGVDLSRLTMLLAIIEKRMGITLSNQDVYLNVVGGIRVDETASDLAVIAAITSAVKNKTIDKSTIFIGEVGLSGEVRSVSGIDRRIKEAKKLGFNKVVVPKGAKIEEDVKVYYVETAKDILNEEFFK